jgi:hypothetical protein
VVCRLLAFAYGRCLWRAYVKNPCLRDASKEYIVLATHLSFNIYVWCYPISTVGCSEMKLQPLVLYFFCHCGSSVYFFLFNLILLHTLVYGHLKVGYLACGDATLMVQIAIRFNTTSRYFEWNRKIISEPGDSLNLS